MTGGRADGRTGRRADGQTGSRTDGRTERRKDGKTDVTSYAVFGDWRIAYEARGAGDNAIVFVHGWSADRSSWRQQMHGLDTERRLVAVDLIGHGESDAPETEYSKRLLAESVAAVMNDLGIERAILVGHSMGVTVVRQFYRLYPDRVEALVAVDGAMIPMAPDRLDQMIAPLRRPDYKAIMEAMMEQMSAVAPGLSTEEVERLKTVTLSTPQHVLLGSAEESRDPDVWKDDPIDVPMLVLMANNPFSPVPLSENEAFVRRIARRLEYHEWEGVSHLLTMERPAEFNALLTEFVERVGNGEV